MDDHLAEYQAELQKFVENVGETLEQVKLMQGNLTMVAAPELKWAALMEHQVILAELQQVRESAERVLSSISTTLHALGQDRATKAFESAQKSSAALALSNTALRDRIVDAIDAMQTGTTLEPITKLVNLMVGTITEHSALTILLARSSTDRVLASQADRLEDGIRQIQKENSRQLLRMAYLNKSRLEQRAAVYGSVVMAPLELQNELEENRTEIERLKEELGL